MQGELRHDGSRFTPLYNRHKNYLRVLMQQGRVQLDADWNEQVDTLLYHLQTLTSDLIGPHGGPPDNLGFEIKEIEAVADNFIIGSGPYGSGHYYVDGILCELNSIAVPIIKCTDTQVSIPDWAAQNLEFQEERYVEVFLANGSLNQVAKIIGTKKDNQLLTLTLDSALNDQTFDLIRPLITYNTQPYYPITSENKLGFGKYVVYLDVWERHITPIEDADDQVPGICEVALGGPDTATRSQIVWQVKISNKIANTDENAGDINDCEKFREVINKKPGQGHLLARAKKPDESKNDPCLISSESKYRGPENQLYRVEIFSIDDKETPYFVWSRENSAVVFPVLDFGTSGDSTIVTLEHLGHDSRFSLSEGDWVEIVDDGYVWQESPRTLLKVTKLDIQERKVYLSGTRDPQVDLNKHPYLRRWDSNKKEVKVPPENQGWIRLEQGIEIKFVDNLESYKVGDYWMLPARTSTGDVEWLGSKDHPVPSLPHGVAHHYAPLAVITVTAEGKGKGKSNVIKVETDCRRKFTKIWEPASDGS
jgi:Family of unknown function (DUF6519)